MKLFLVALCVAAAVAEPEADPQLLLRSPYSTGYYNTYNPYTSSAFVRPSVYTNGFYGNNFYNRYFKRDADAEADPALIYKSGIYGYGSTPYTAFGGYQTPYTTPFLRSNVYGSVYPSVYNRFLYKREAEAEADPALIYNYNGLYQTPYTTTAGLYRSPISYTSGYVNPYSTYSTNFYNRYLFKREAEAEADPALIYNYNGLYQTPYTTTAGLYRSPITYSAGYNSGMYQPYTGFNAYNRFLYKRDADADAATVYKQGTFHTNLANLHKGIHTGYTQNYQPAQLYNTYTTPFVSSPVYNAYSNFPYYY